MTGFAAIMRDIRDEKAKENLLIFAAKHDPLTGLPNRAMITDTLGDAIERANRQNTTFAVLFLDLDHFKGINDTLGHDGGDELLKRVAKRLCSTVRPFDQVGRLGGDEFIVILESINDILDVTQLAMRILTLMKVPTMIHRHKVYITPSMGVATYPDCGQTPRELLQKADMAMYHTKSSGRNGFQFYAESLQHAALHHAKTKQQIILGLQNNSFYMVYQEIVNREQKVIGWEALVRWRSEDGNVIGPDEFIPVAEQTGLIVELGQWIISKAISQFSLLSSRDNCVEFPTLSINLSALQLHDLDLLKCLKKRLKAANIPINQVILELTESALIEKDNHSFKVIEALASAGFTLAMDDFGTGYASFKHLQQLPISIVKIDRSFITNVHEQPSKAAIVDALLSMADALELDIMVEGIETFEERQFFQGRSCDKFQGYYFHKPSTA